MISKLKNRRRVRLRRKQHYKLKKAFRQLRMATRTAPHDISMAVLVSARQVLNAAKTL